MSADTEIMALVDSYHERCDHTDVQWCNERRREVARKIAALVAADEINGYTLAQLNRTMQRYRKVLEPEEMCRYWIAQGKTCLQRRVVSPYTPAELCPRCEALS